MAFCALKACADTQQRHRRCAVAQHGQTLVQHRRKVDCQERERQTRENTQYDRVGDDAAQRLPTRPRWSACCASGAVTVSTSTEKMLYSGTLATIISGTRPALPYRFCTKATPSIACEPRKAPCVNAPTILLSLRKRDAPIQTAKKHRCRTRTEKEKHGVELLGDASLCDIAEQQDRQQHLERQTVKVGQRLLGEKKFFCQAASGQAR